MREPHLMSLDRRNFTPERWQELRQEITHEAQIARTQATRHLFSTLPASVRHLCRAAGTIVRVLVDDVTRVFGKWWRAYAKHRECRAAVHELYALDDRSLRDIGISRSEIESVVYGADATRLLDATIAAAKCQRSAARPRPSAKPRRRQSPAHLGRKSAA